MRNNSPTGLPDELIEQYIKHRFQDLSVLKQAVKERDLELIARTGHRLKGSGRPYGFPQLGKLGRELLGAARAGDLEAAQQHVRALAQWLSRHANHTDR